MLVIPIRVLALDIDGVITDGKIRFDSPGNEQKVFGFHDLDAVTRARKNGLHVVLITGESDDMVLTIARRFGVDEVDVTTGAKDKLSAIESVAARLQIGAEAFCYIDKN